MLPEETTISVLPNVKRKVGKINKEKFNVILKNNDDEAQCKTCDDSNLKA